MMAGTIRACSTERCQQPPEWAVLSPISVRLWHFRPFCTVLSHVIWRCPGGLSSPPEEVQTASILPSVSAICPNKEIRLDWTVVVRGDWLVLHWTSGMDVVWMTNILELSFTAWGWLKKMGAMTISNKPVGQYYKLMTGRKMKMQKVNIKWKTITQQNACRLLQRLSLNLQIKKMPKILT